MVNRTGPLRCGGVKLLCAYKSFRQNGWCDRFKLVVRYFHHQADGGATINGQLGTTAEALEVLEHHLNQVFDVEYAKPQKKIFGLRYFAIKCMLLCTVVSILLGQVKSFPTSSLLHV
jgi:hypothetical protein